MDMNVWKTATIILSVFQITQAWQIWVCKGSIDNCLKFPYQNAAQICTSGYFDPALKTYIFGHAYRSNLLLEAPKKLINTLLAKGDRNVMCIDWSDEANCLLIGVDYILFAQKVSDEMTTALINMPCVRPETVIIIGMSLGAHIAGNIGRQYNKITGNSIAMVIGLDPAKPLYDDPLTVFIGIRIDSAACVVVIYADGYKYGITTSRGHINFRPNANTYDRDRHQPGCSVSLPPPFYIMTNEDLCNHRQALLWYIYALLYPYLFIGIKSEGTQTWVEGKTDPNQLNYIGDEINTEFSGNFYLHTNPEPPYGLGMAGITPVLQ